MTQTDAVLSLLKERGTRGLTALEALDEIGCLRLAARIEELRKDGQPIVSETVRNVTTGKRYSRYFYLAPANAEQLAVGW